MVGRAESVATPRMVESCLIPAVGVCFVVTLLAMTIVGVGVGVLVAVGVLVGVRVGVLVGVEVEVGVEVDVSVANVVGS